MFKKLRASKACWRFVWKCIKRSSKTLKFWAGVFSIGYCGIVYYLVSKTNQCALTDFMHLGQYPDHSYFDRLLGCKSINELGDFLAGAFAPLAFLWLVVAVFIQSKELEEQRNELRLTRKEYKMMRDEVTRSTTQMVEQTRILKVAQRKEHIKELGNVYDAKMEAFKDLLGRTDFTIEIEYSGLSAYQTSHERSSTRPAKFNLGINEDGYIDDFEHAMADAEQAVTSRLQLGNSGVISVIAKTLNDPGDSINKLMKLYAELGSLEKYSYMISSEKQIRIKNDHISENLARLDKSISDLKKHIDSAD